MNDLSQRELAAALNVDERTILNYKKAGCPDEFGLFDIVEVRKWMKANNLTGDRGAPTEMKTDILKAKVRKENALAAKHEHALLLARKEVVFVSDVRAARLERIQATRAKLLALPDKWAARVANRSTVECHKELREAIWEVLNAFSQDDGVSDLGERVA